MRDNVSLWMIIAIKPPIVALNKLLPPGSQDEESDSEGDKQASDMRPNRGPSLYSRRTRLPAACFPLLRLFVSEEVEAGDDDDLLAERVDQEHGHRHCQDSKKGGVGYRQDGKKGGVGPEMGTELSFTHYFYSENEN